VNGVNPITHQRQSDAVTEGSIPSLSNLKVSMMRTDGRLNVMKYQHMDIDSVGARAIRVHTDRLLEMIENKELDPADVVKMCVKYMSEDDVEDMMDGNELSERFDPEDDYDDDDGQPDEAQEWHDYDPDC
jgi:hypothetical protein